MKKYPDWFIRAMKTFVQTFGGIVIPEVCILLNGGFPESWPAVWAILSPIIASGLSAAICALWNIVLEYLKDEEEK